MNETVVIKVSVDCVMVDYDDDDLDGLGDMNKHVHLECVVFEDIIIMTECDKIV